MATRTAVHLKLNTLLASSVVKHGAMKHSMFAATLGTLSFTWGKAMHSARQVSLLVSDCRSCHFPIQCQCCLNNKYTCTHLCAHGCVGFKMRCCQAHWWCIAVLGQQKAFGRLTSRKLVLSQWRSILLLF